MVPWVPRIPSRLIPALIKITLQCVFVTGLYGALHDQLSYTISPEYFTHFKFQQFAYADWGAPPRVLVAEIGFLVTWWFGLIGGWIIARAGLAELNERSGRSHTWRAIGLALGVAAAVGLLGILAPTIYLWDGLAGGSGDAPASELHRQCCFLVVACLHWASYLGGVAGVVVAVVDVRRQLRRLPTSSQPA